MSALLSTAQWHVLQDTFDAANSLAPEAQAAFVDDLRRTDPQVADALAAMLDANRQWLNRTLQARAELAAAITPSAIGTRVGAFQLMTEIGRGGMGTVYLGERVDGQVAHQVAIKVLHAHCLDANTRERFQRERDILAAFDHPGIARLLCAGETDAGEPYYVMEYLRGQPILMHCDQLHAPIRQRLALFLEICDAVQYAHGKLILHRDIKASNVLTDSAGTPKLIDFGIAKTLATITGVTAEQTALQHRYFSPINAAPEQVRGNTASVACDVYQLGTLLYELLCGSPIFDLRGLTPTEVERRICETEPTPPSVSALAAPPEVVQARGVHSSAALARALRGDLDAIVMRALRKGPEQRYSSVDHLARDIERHLANQPIHGHRGSQWYRTSRFLRRNWRSVTAASTAVVGIALFTTLLAMQVTQTRIERDRAVAEKQRAQTEKKHAEAMTQFLLGIFKFNPAHVVRRDTPVGTVLDRGAQMIDEQFKDDPRTGALLASALGNLYQTMDELGRNAELCRHAVELAERMAEPDHALLGQLYLNLAGAHINNTRFEEAADAAARSLAAFERAGVGYERSWYSRVVQLRLMRRQGDEPACRETKRFVDDMRPLQPAEPNGFAAALMQDSFCGPRTPERLTTLLADLRGTRAVLTRTFGPEHDTNIKLKRRESAVLLALGRVDEAEEVERAMLPDLDRIYGVTSWAHGLSTLALGNIAYRQRRFDVAESYYRDAQAIFHNVHNDRPHGNVASVHYGLARVSHFGHGQLAKAESLYREALRVARDAYGVNSADVRQMEADYGTLLHRRGNQEAEAVLRHALDDLPGNESAGARARISLAALVHSRDHALAARLVGEADAGLRSAFVEDPSLEEQVRTLREKLGRPSAPPQDAIAAAVSKRIAPAAPRSANSR
ncbi:serine/threonine-protein kinase [Tahibacter amnicola]|uniref:Serine/threonine-protein kinase n=1 Tax=Tahibacter amnicola TaxID=2976241 RepID=A0ABY6BHQ3_9GAMM|nr:serine/threonine-protein kinase [Tahibacter amnicola]UXI69529.1 serine/threonine-protein kinase [Tahibacter amnicola]